MDEETQRQLTNLGTRDAVTEVALINLIAELAAANVINARTLASKLRTIARADENAEARSSLDGLAGRIEQKVGG